MTSFSSQQLRDRISHHFKTNAINTQLYLFTLMVIPCHHQYFNPTGQIFVNQKQECLDFQDQLIHVIEKVCEIK
jgi:hypothetical protein